MKNKFNIIEYESLEFQIIFKSLGVIKKYKEIKMAIKQFIFSLINRMLAVAAVVINHNCYHNHVYLEVTDLICKLSKL